MERAGRTQFCTSLFLPGTSWLQRAVFQSSWDPISSIIVQRCPAQEHQMEGQVGGAGTQGAVGLGFTELRSLEQGRLGRGDTLSQSSPRYRGASGNKVTFWLLYPFPAVLFSSSFRSQVGEGFSWRGQPMPPSAIFITHAFRHSAMGFVSYASFYLGKQIHGKVTCITWSLGHPR